MDDNYIKTQEVLMKDNGKGIAVIVAYIITMLVIGIVSIATIKKEATISQEDKTDTIETTVVTEVIYIPTYANEDSETESETEERQVVYTVKSHDGRLAICVNGEISYILDVYINTLPKTDKALLEEGIVVYSERELYRIIEDYSS